MAASEATAPRYDKRGQRLNPDRKSRKGYAPRTKGRKFPPQALKTHELEALLQACVPTSKHAGEPSKQSGRRLRAIVILMWRTGLRVQEALDLEERDLDPEQRQITVRCGKGGKRRIVGMDGWAWSLLEVWLTERRQLPPGKVFPVLTGPTAGGPWEQTDVRRTLRRAAMRAELRVRVHPHALRHSFCVDAWRDKIDIVTISRQLGHSRLDITQAYLVSLGADDLLVPVTLRKAPMVPLDLGGPEMPLPFS